MMKFILLTQVVWRDNDDCQTQEERLVLVNTEEIQGAETTHPGSETIITFKLAGYVRVKETPEEIYKKIYPAQGIGYYMGQPMLPGDEQGKPYDLPDQVGPDTVSTVSGFITSGDKT